MRTINTGVSTILAIGLLAGSGVGVTAQDEAEGPPTLVTEEVEPGVERVVRDDAGHDLDETHPTYRYDMDGIAVTSDGTVWITSTYSRSDNDANPEGPLVWALGRPGIFGIPEGIPATGPTYVVAQADGSLLVIGDRAVRFDGEAFVPDDGPAQRGVPAGTLWLIAPDDLRRIDDGGAIPRSVLAAVWDGWGWVSLSGLGRQAETPTAFCWTSGIGVSCEDHQENVTTYLAGTEISALAAAPDGTIWAVGGYAGDNGGLYRITPTGSEPVTEAAAPVAFTELRVAYVAALDERTRDLTIESPSVGEVKVRLLLPAGYDEDPEATYPVLYLLHGAEDDYTSWTRETDVAELTADLDLLVVMPDAGEWGWYSDWWNGGEGGPPAWETFHLEELRVILERDWRAGDERVVAGLSMGGYGAMQYATAHPELFKAAASFSGVVDPNGTGQGLAIDPMAWGDPVEQADIWAAHDPVAMAEALAGKPVYLSWGDGQPGPLDPAGATLDDLEAWVAPQNEALASRLEQLGIDATVDSGAGTHTWPYWQQGLHQALPILLAALGQ